MFLRIHRSLIVNVKHIQELETGPHGEYIVVLHGGTRLQSSRSYHEKIKTLGFKSVLKAGVARRARRR